jgi:hypothetical protein
VQAHIEGDVSGQIAVGDRNVQIGSIHGGVVTVNVQDRPQVRPRDRPVSVLPRPFAGLLGRREELEAIGAALSAVEPVDLYGPPGVGKTSLLHYLAHHAPSASYPDGIVHLSGRQALEDLQQSLYDAFYVADVPTKASEAEIRHALQEIAALVVLDDVGLSRAESRTRREQGSVFTPVHSGEPAP